MGDATTIDSLKIEWPSKKVDRWANVAANQVSTMIEGSTITAVAEEESHGAPKTFALQQNYPNPFWSEAASCSAGNPSTTIAFSLPRASVVELVVFDLAGKEVTRLVNDFKNAGEHKLTFAAKDLPSGVYVYRLRAGDFVPSRKMILLR